jgi:hypothetical protein
MLIYISTSQRSPVSHGPRIPVPKRRSYFPNMSQKAFERASSYTKILNLLHYLFICSIYFFVQYAYELFVRCGSGLTYLIFRLLYKTHITYVSLYTEKYGRYSLRYNCIKSQQVHYNDIDEKYLSDATLDLNQLSDLLIIIRSRSENASFTVIH